MVPRSPLPIAAMWASILLLLAASASAQQYYFEDFPSRRLEVSSRRLEIAVTNSDEYAESVLTVSEPKYPLGIGKHDHARISTILETTKEMIDTAKVLIQNERTLSEGREMMDKANSMFRQVKASIMDGNKKAKEQLERDGEDLERSLIRRKYSEHDIEGTEEDDQRALDIARKIYETMVTFPECVEQLFEDCLAIINEEIVNLGLSTIEVVVHEKRNVNQDGYNKVVIITNELADRVMGRGGDGIVSYPFMWNDNASGARHLGVDGKWNCHDYTPEDCCDSIKQSAPNADTRGKNIECHIFVPFGGVGNPRRNDRVFINLSPDGRVHEPPIIQ